MVGWKGLTRIIEVHLLFSCFVISLMISMKWLFKCNNGRFALPVPVALFDK